MAEKFTAAQVIEAIKASKGMIYITARRLGCAPNTVYNYAKRYQSVQDAIREERGHMIDTAEMALEKAVRKGEPWAVCFMLKTLGKDRGYVERQEHSGPEGGPIEVDVAGLSDEERIARIVSILDAARERRARQVNSTPPVMGAIAGPADSSIQESS